MCVCLLHPLSVPPVINLTVEAERLTADSDEEWDEEEVRQRRRQQRAQEEGTSSTTQGGGEFLAEGEDGEEEGTAAYETLLSLQVRTLVGWGMGPCCVRVWSSAHRMGVVEWTFHWCLVKGGDEDDHTYL